MVKKDFQMVGDSILVRFKESLEELGKSIKLAKMSLQDKVSPEVLDRVNQYDDIHLKQLELYEDLVVAVENHDSGSIDRIVGLVNGLSTMLRDDARVCLLEFSNKALRNNEDLD